MSFYTGDGQPPGDPGDKDMELAVHTLFPPGPSEPPREDRLPKGVRLNSQRRSTSEFCLLLFSC